MRLVVLLAGLLLAGCGRIDVDCKAGTVSIKEGFSSPHNSTTNMALLLLSQCPKDVTEKK